MKSLLIDLVNNIDNNVNFEESLLQITKLIKTGKIDENDIIDAVLNSFVNDKNKVLNDIAVYLYNNQLYDYIIPLLSKSYELNNQHRDIVYNFSYILHLLGENNLALEYLNNLEEKDEEILNLIQEVKLNTNIYPNTSIVILTHNNLDYTKLCIESIRRYTPNDTYEIIVVDNNSTDGTVEWLKNQKDLKIILNNENLGFPKGCNQGIEIARKENDILLLNNDVIVTPNWLDNLRKCLYSNEKIGAVGPVTNRCSNYQTISVKYDNIQDMLDFAKDYNKSNEKKWEERLRLIGYCLFIKREVVNKIGLLDEIFTPGNFEDDDYSFRIRKEGYRLYLCKDTFIHHFGGKSFGKVSEKYSELLVINRKKFTDKWGFDPYYISEIKKEITELIINEGVSNPEILHIGCSGGGTLLDIKNRIPSSNLFGIETVKETIVNTQHFAKIEAGKLNEINDFKDKKFDYIIITELQESIDKVLEILRYTKGNLKDEGKILICLSANKIKLSKTIIEKLKKEIGDYTYEIKIINDQEIFYVKKTNVDLEERKLEIKIYSKNDLIYMKYDEFYDKNIYNSLIKIIKRIDNEVDFDNNIQKLRNYIQKYSININELKTIVFNHVINKINLFNIIGIIYYEFRMVDESLEFLQEAYSLDNKNIDTIYNIAYILHKANENQLALEFIKNIDITEDDAELYMLKQQIEEEI